MIRGAGRVQICFGLVFGVALLVLFGVVGGIGGAVDSYGGESLWQAAPPEPPAGRQALSSSLVVSETAWLPVVRSRPVGGQWLAVWAEESRAPAIMALAQAAARDHGLHLSVTIVDNMQQALHNADLIGWGPDIFVGAHDRMGSWLKAGVVMPVDLGSKRADFVQVALDGFSHDDQLFGLPYAFENLALFRNADLVPDAPQSWADLMAVGQALQASQQVSHTLALEDNGYKVYPIATTFGGYVFDRLESGAWITASHGITSTGMISAGDWIADGVGAGLIPPTAHDADWAETLFETGRVPFIMTGPWALERFRDSGVNYAISAFPDGGQPFVGVFGFILGANSPKQDLATQFLTEYVATSETMALLYQYEQRPPAYKPLLATLTDPDLAGLVAAGSGGEPMPAVPEMGCVWGPWNAAVVRIVTLAQTPQEALNQAAGEIQPCISQAYKGMVNLPGSFQTLAGCQRDWDPACLATAMSKTNGFYTATFTLPAGDYLVKVALDGNWEENYGLDGVRDGANIPFNVPSTGPVRFSYDPQSHLLSIAVEP